MAGRPLKYETPEEMQQTIDDYFVSTPSDEVTITGLALHLGFSERRSLIEYSGRKEFMHTIKNAKLRVELEYEKSLRQHGRSGDIFALKNFGWKDQQHIETENVTKQHIVVDSEETKKEIEKLRDIEND